MPLAFDDELRSIAAAAREMREKLAQGELKPLTPAIETLEDVSAVFGRFPFCQEMRAALSTYPVSLVVGSDRWEKTFEYSCISISYAPDGLIKTGLFARTGPGDEMLRADEHRIRLMNSNTFACAAVGAKECAMALARILAQHV